MPFRANLAENLHLRFFWYMGRVTMNALGFLFSRSVIFITNKTAMSIGHIASHTQWTASLLVVPPRQWLYWCTIRGRSATMNLTRIDWIRTVFHLWFILPSSMTVVSFALCFGTRMYRRKNPILRAPVLNIWTHLLTCYSQAR